MTRLLIFVAIVSLVLLLIDLYAFQAVKTALKGHSAQFQSLFKFAFWAYSIATLVTFYYSAWVGPGALPKAIKVYVYSFITIVLLCKLLIICFLLVEDLTRALRWVSAQFKNPKPGAEAGITRSEFLSRMAIITAAIPFGLAIHGIMRNAYNYRIHKVKIPIVDLPEEFEGFKIVQISDIHAGSFTKVDPLYSAVKMINDIKADAVFFTGDLVNSLADEMDDYVDIFKHITAKHGVFSVTGNHDYGHYHRWEYPEEEAQNFEKFKGIHKAMGWNLLMNEHVKIERDGKRLAIIGVENYAGIGRFGKHGKMHEAYPGCEDCEVKLLLTHDPSHWDAQIRKEYQGVDVTFSGHTHGFQLGIETKWLKWSPSQLMYKQWAGLYEEEGQFIYVNRGFGFLGYPGRIGILPEISQIELTRA